VIATPVGVSADLAAPRRATPRVTPAPRPRSVRLVDAAVVLMVLVVSAALLFTADSRVALAPVLLGMVGLALWALPLRLPLLGLLCLTVLADFTPPLPVPTGQMWFFPIRWLQFLLLENLNKITGIGALRVSGVEVILAGLVMLVAARTWWGKREDARTHAAPVMPLLVALALAVGVLLLGELWGVVRGGSDGRQSVWQLKYLLWTPVLAALAMYVIRKRSHLIEIALAMTAVACVKVAIGVTVYIWALRVGLGKPHSVTSHADTVLFTVVIGIWTAVLLHRATVVRAMIGLPVILWMLLGIVVNNRRTAYVTLAVVLVLIVIYLPRATRRVAMLAGIAFLPLLAMYLVAGRGRSGPLWAPAASVWSVSTQEDASSDSRDVENYNLTLTLRNHFLTGMGFGHPYEQGPSSYDLSAIFEQYQFVAHNSVLWLLAILGPLGFAVLWMPVSLAMFFGARCLRRARDATDRIAATVAITILAAYQIQAWADMGTQGWTGASLVALAMGGVSVLVRETRAWRTTIPARPQSTWTWWRSERDGALRVA
jgi:hypothetical protein